MKNPVNWFEIPAEDLDRAVEFYEALMEVKLNRLTMQETEMAMFDMQDQEYGATGAIVKGEGYVPSKEGSIIYFNAGEDLSPALARVEENGGQVIVGKTSIGEHGFIAHFMDTEGNRVALHSTN